MAEREQVGVQQQLLEPSLQSPAPNSAPSQSPAPNSAPSQSPTTSEDMIGCVAALEAALLPCLPARELQDIHRCPHPPHQIDLEKHTRDFMEAAEKLQLYLTAPQLEDRPRISSAEILRKDIATMEEEVKVKTAIIKKQEQLIEGWRRQLKDRLDRHKAELTKV